ncbi:hypothetical protein ACF0H5_021152 [Mactra antiquata]
MNSKLVLSTILLVAFACLVKDTDGLRCYYWDDFMNPFNATYATIKECEYSCATVNASVIQFPYRGCSQTNATNEICVSHSYGGITTERCTCISDLCNGGCIGDLCNGGLMYGLSHILSALTFAVMVVIAKFW